MKLANNPPGGDKEHYHCAVVGGLTTSRIHHLLVFKNVSTRKINDHTVIMYMNTCKCRHEGILFINGLYIITMHQKHQYSYFYLFNGSLHFGTKCVHGYSTVINYLWYLNEQVLVNAFHSKQCTHCSYVYWTNVAEGKSLNDIIRLNGVCPLIIVK